MTAEASSSAASPHATLQTEATSIGELLREHGSLARGHLVSFCLDDPWSSLPAAWREALLALTDAELARLPVDLPVRDDWPATLQRLVRISRRSCALSSPLPREAEADPPSRWLFAQTPRVRNMNLKKAHEVAALAPLVAQTARRCGATAVVDLGSGLGYLGGASHTTS